MPWDPAVKKALPVEVETLFSFDNEDGEGQTYETTTPIPDDPILAAYEAPRLEGFEEQDNLIRQLKAEGKLLSVDGESVVMDPMRGVGMPRL